MQNISAAVAASDNDCDGDDGENGGGDNDGDGDNDNDDNCDSHGTQANIREVKLYACHDFKRI